MKQVIHRSLRLEADVVNEGLMAVIHTAPPRW
jgi:hypothetical protein